MTDPNQPTSATHATHDLVMIAALAARASDLSATEHAQARDMVATCTACADVLADVVLLQAALPTTSTPARHRDFSLTPADAARLRAGGWRRLLGFFGSARGGFTRPLAASLTTLGLAGLLLASVPGLYSASGAATVPGGGASVEQAAPAEGGEADGTGRLSITAEPGASDDAGVFTGGNPEDLGSEPDVAGDGSLRSIRDDASGLSALFVIAGLLLIVGLALFGLRWSARRLL